MIGFLNWVALEQLQGPKKMRSPKPTGTRSLSMKPALPANVTDPTKARRPKYFTGVNIFGQTKYNPEPRGAK